MYPNYMKPTFNNTANPSFGGSTSTFGQQPPSTSLFPSTNVFQSAGTSSFSATPAAQNTFGMQVQQPLTPSWVYCPPMGNENFVNSFLKHQFENSQWVQSIKQNSSSSSNSAYYTPPEVFPVANARGNPFSPPFICQNQQQILTHSSPIQDIYPTPADCFKQYVRESAARNESARDRSPILKEYAVQHSTSFGSIGGNLFGQQPQPSTSGLFSTNNSFGQNKAAFGFATAPAQTGIFGQQPQPQASASLFQSGSNNLFGGNAFGNQQPPTGTVIKFTPATGTDTMQKNGVTQSISTKHHCITCMKEYEGKSFEELRFEDYSCNRKGPQQQPGFGAAPFGGAPSGTTNTIFGQADNKQTFGQPQTFGQTPAFGQTPTGFGVGAQNNAPSLFGKPAAFGAPTSNTSTFGFNPPASSSNLFSANNPPKPFSQQPVFGVATTQQQPTFGSPIFGQTNTHANMANLLQKPAQPNNGFAGQSGFSFNQPGTTQASNLFQVSKPNTGFGLFGQTNTATPSFGQTNQNTFGNNFGKLTATPFNQQTVPTFGSNLTGGLQQQQPLFGSTANKAPNLFGSPLTGGGLFGGTMFQQTPQTFSLTMNQQQPIQFPQESIEESRGMRSLASDSYPDGPHVYGLEPVLSDASTNTTNPQDIKAMLDYSKTLDDSQGSRAKLKVQQPKPKRGSSGHDEFFDSNLSSRSSHRCLTIRKFNDSTSSIYNKYKNEVLEEADQCIQPERIVQISVESAMDEAVQTVPEIVEVPEETPPPVYHETSVEPETEDIPPKIVLTKPEYYIHPPLADMAQYTDEFGEVVVPNLTVGRKGYGNIHFAGPINITNMNFDEIVHFRHREVIVYPDESKKPPVGEGLNRPAQVTLDKIYPRERDSGDYVLDVDQIIKSNFVDNLMHVTQKHSCKFVDYRPDTGSWVFKVKHFSKYGFTDSDEEDCQVATIPAQPVVLRRSHEFSKLREIDEEKKDIGLGGQIITLLKMEKIREDREAKEAKEAMQASQSLILDTSMLDYWPAEQLTLNEDVYRSSDFETDILKPQVVVNARTIKHMTFKVGWDRNFSFFNIAPVIEPEVRYQLSQLKFAIGKNEGYNAMMPSVTSLLKVTFEESEFTFAANATPTLNIKRGFSFLLKQTELFNEHVINEQLKGRELYLEGVWNLCSALWGPGSNTPRSRKQRLSIWLKKFAHRMSNNWSVCETVQMGEPDSLKAIFQLLSFYKIAEAADYADQRQFNQLSLLITQLSANQRFKTWLDKVVQSFDWNEKDVVLVEFKKIMLLLSGKAFDSSVNVFENLDWLRCFGLYLWYLSPIAASISEAFNLYKKAFDELLATKPIPPYCNTKTQARDYDLIYHILALYVDKTYRLGNLLHPETHTNDVTDYKLSWFLLQVFLSLDVGTINQVEHEYLHTTFSSQLENIGDWKSAVLVLLYLKNDLLKKNMILKILDRNLSSAANNEEILVRQYKIPASWIHEVQATKSKFYGNCYLSFQHLHHMGSYHNANSALVDEIIPDLVNNDQTHHLSKFIDKILPFAEDLVDWSSEAGLVGDLLDLESSIRTNVPSFRSVGNQFNSIFRRINSFPRKNEIQLLCSVELCRKCALIIERLLRIAESQNNRKQFVNIFKNLIWPQQFKSFDIYYEFHKVKKYNGY